MEVAILVAEHPDAIILHLHLLELEQLHLVLSVPGCHVALSVALRVTLRILLGFELGLLTGSIIGGQIV